MLRLTVSTEAFDEADEASAYYSAINVALGEKFDAELHALYYKIQNSPQHYSYLSKSTKAPIGTLACITFLSLLFLV